MIAILSDGVRFLAMLLRHPLLLAAPAIVAAILCGAGRSFGLPLLFWHERREPQVLAGLAATLLVAETSFVAYLLGGPGHIDAHLVRFMTAAAVTWAVILGLAVVWRLVGRIASPEGDTGGVTPGVRSVSPGGPGPLHAAQPPVWPLLGGAALGVVAAGGLTWLGLWVATDGCSLAAWLLRPLLNPGDDPCAHGFAAILFFAVLAAYVLGRPVATPAVGLCLLLSLIVGAYGGFVFQVHSPGVVLIVVGVVLLIGGLPRYKTRVPALARRYDEPAAYPPDENAAAEARRRLVPLHDVHGGREPRPLVVVCASGGGIRAAVWTAAVLEQLDRLPGFLRAVRLVTGASGGMVGAAFWVAQHHQRLAGEQGAGGTLARLVARDSLTDVAHRLVFHDVPCAFLPAVNAHDRGRAMEEAWQRRPGESLAVPVGALRAYEERGELPSLVFTPMLVEDGRRLLIGNVDLSEVTSNLVHWIGDSGASVASRSAVHVEELFPGALESFPLATAARLSASFPYVSPAVVLPTSPRRRVVDAGYYDNYGLSLACEWLRECLISQRDWLRAHVSRVLLIQIRDNVSELSISGDARRSPDALAVDSRQTSSRGALGRGLEWMTSPMSGVFAAREAVMLFRNDAALEGVTARYEAEMGAGFLTTTIFEFKGEASLSWYLTETEIGTICAQATEGVARKVAAVGRWLEKD